MAYGAWEYLLGASPTSLAQSGQMVDTSGQSGQKDSYVNDMNNLPAIAQVFCACACMVCCMCMVSPICMYGMLYIYIYIYIYI